VTEEKEENIKDRTTKGQDSLKAQEEAVGPLNVYNLHLQWAHVGFSDIIGHFACGVYQVL
jgi:hypothetical protein